MLFSFSHISTRNSFLCACVLATENSSHVMLLLWQTGCEPIALLKNYDLSFISINHRPKPMAVSFSFCLSLFLF